MVEFMKGGEWNLSVHVIRAFGLKKMEMFLIFYYFVKRIHLD